MSLSDEERVSIYKSYVYELRGVLPLYSLFLEKADYLLKDKGKLTIITARPQPFLEPLKKFKLEKQLIIDKNNLKYYILVFKKLI